MNGRRRRPAVNAMSAYSLPAPELAGLVGCDARRLLRMLAVGAVEGYRAGRSWHISAAAAIAAFPSTEALIRRRCEAVAAVRAEVRT